MRNASGIDKSSETTVSPAQAVVRGHLVISLPVLVIMGLSHLLGRITVGRDKALLCLGAGTVAGYLWWSIMVPQWRKWAKSHGAEEERTQRLAEWTGLVWPKGSYLEKTEFRSWKGD